MTDHDPGVTQLLRRATDDLQPDTDRLVAGGVARGRTLRRRRQVGTALASAAVVAIVGAGAASVPLLSGNEAGSQLATAPSTSPPTATSTPTTTPTPSTTSPPPEARRLAVPADEIPGVVANLAPGHKVGAALTEPPYGLANKVDERVVHFRIDGMLASVVITRASQSLAYDCTDENVECHTLDDGTVVQLPAPSTADGVTMRGALAIGERWMVDVMSYNAADGKDAQPVQPEPALTEDELVTIATSNVWFS